jgi:hypothetical protein
VSSCINNHTIKWYLFWSSSTSFKINLNWILLVLTKLIFYKLFSYTYNITFHLNCSDFVGKRQQTTILILTCLLYWCYQTSTFVLLILDSQVSLELLLFCIYQFSHKIIDKKDIRNVYTISIHSELRWHFEDCFVGWVGHSLNFLVRNNC